MKLEERICACGCRKTFKCLPTSGTRYSSLHCMEAAGALPPVDKFGRGTKPARTEASPPKVAAETKVEPAPAPVKSGKAVAAALGAPKANAKAAAKTPQKNEPKAASSKTTAKSAGKKATKTASNSSRSKRAPEASL